jgi:hypothetical protein
VVDVIAIVNQLAILLRGRWGDNVPLVFRGGRPRFEGVKLGIVGWGCAEDCKISASKFS